ncbi:MAG: hypothetical protein ACM3SR_08460 [Ignavibacteriales bacterium]
MQIDMSKTKDEIIKEYLAKRISPILDAKDWKRRPHELVDLAAHAKLYKVYLIIENAIELEQPYCDEIKFAGQQWVIVKYMIDQ